MANNYPILRLGSLKTPASGNQWPVLGAGNWNEVIAAAAGAAPTGALQGPLYGCFGGPIG